MGEVAETMTKKKKKGRPSLLDLQKRALKQQQLEEQLQQQKKSEHRSDFKSPNSLNTISAPGRRSTRRNHNSDGISRDSAWIDDDDDDERREKKHKLLHGLNSHDLRFSPLNSLGRNSQSGCSDLNVDDAGENSEAASLKRRKIGTGSDGMGEKVSKATDILHGSPVESGPTTPLPDKKLLVFILDRLQKKDTYGVFSEPVDPEELPDYHEIIANPMDFSTVRKKLDTGAYANFEQFEKDVFLICTNAMEYNSPDTIYFRQARAMHEMAKKDFENLRQESEDDEPQAKVVRRGRPPGKSLKKQLDIPSVERVASEFSADTTLASGGEGSRMSGSYNLRKAPTPSSYRFPTADMAVRGTPNGGDAHGSWSADWENEFPASVVRAVNKYGMKHFLVDENKRDTYNQSLTSAHEPSVLTTLEDELKQLIPVGLNSEHGYARSLAQFAANLSPVAWKIASRKIQHVLPPGLKFGPGWIGENPSSEDPQKQILLSGQQKHSNNSVSDDHPYRILSPPACVSNSFIGNRQSLQGGEETESSRRLNSDTEFVLLDSLNPMHSSSSQIQPGPLINTSRNGFFGGLGGFNQLHQTGMGRNPIAPNGLGEKCYGNLTNLGPTVISRGAANDDFHRLTPDLNARLVPPASPGSNLQTGLSQQPDLALQL